ncbi:porin [Chitinivibrio alkaliphilus]|uniref:Uncharacterized protein n=1 Tax=Chitinivibrio alkaliphilus ACht1 TaxID=1313304 RepID=U7D584_9BACT|nr:porin [Chitinivibrio alkaliphilus]ERP30726.1 hypothetical protein CALK_2441 [Chitinivibrio alkaliphilus ACht1]
MIFLFFLFLLVFLQISAADVLDIELLIQPMLTVEEDGNSSDEWESEFGFTRVRSDFLFTRDVLSSEVRASLMTDFTDAGTPDIVKNAYIEIRFPGNLHWRTGQFKMPFGFESTTSSKDIPFANRGEISSYIRDNLGITGGFWRGTRLRFRHSTPRIERADYEFGLFKNSPGRPDADLTEAYGKRLFSLPVASATLTFSDNLTLYGAIAAPYYEGIGTQSGIRVLLGDFGASYRISRYSGMMEFFLGADTADTRQYLKYASTDTEGLSRGISLRQSYDFDLAHKYGLTASVRFEQLYGKAYTSFEYINRDFLYTLTWGTRLYIDTDLYIDLEYSDRYDSGFSSRDLREIALQLSGYFSFPST